jgi:hypothetical protein
MEEEQVSILHKIKNDSLLLTIVDVLCIGSLAFLSILSRSSFVIGCATCALLFAGIKLWTRHTTAYRKIGILLVLPSLGLIGSAVGFIFLPEPDMPLNLTYGIIGVSAVMTASLIAGIFTVDPKKSVAARFGFLANCAAISAPASLSISLILRITNQEESATLVCMTTAILGGLAFLIAADMILVSLSEYKSTKNSLQKVSALIKSKKLALTRIAVGKDVFSVLAKTALSIISTSFFMFANALYSAGLGGARLIAIKMYAQNEEQQIKSYRNVGIIISASSICYVLYSIRLFFGGSQTDYNMIIGIAIACYTFLEFGINIRDALRLRKSKALETKAVRAISLSSTLLCFVLTQTAIMSFVGEGDNSFTNALSGVGFGGVAALVGIYVMVESRMLKKVEKAAN